MATLGFESVRLGMGLRRSCTLTTSSQKVFNDRTLPIFALLLLCLLLIPMHIVLWRSIENVEVSVTSIADFQDTCKISASIAVVWSAPDRAQAIIVENLVSFLTELMCPQYV